MLNTKKFLNTINNSLKKKEGYYSVEFLEELAEKVDDYLDKRVNLSSNEEDALEFLSKQLWDIACSYPYCDEYVGTLAQKELISDIKDTMECVYGRYEAKH